ncbi:MAG: response regulator [Actinobacteria bacterium]|nr:MAG: response regulator [Actinomycetota bacterium]
MAKVLVVDDEPAIRLLLQAILAQEGHDVDTAADGVDALAAVQRELPDVVLLDLAMPNMDGWHFLEELRSLGLRSRVRVIIVSATTDSESMARGQAEGINERIAKPFDATAIVKAVEAMVQEPAEEILARREHPEDLARLIDKLQSLGG